VVLGMVPLGWLWLCRGGRLNDISVVAPEARPWSAPEVRALMLFGLTIALWVTRTAPFGGWSAALGLDQVGDHTVALGMVVLAFLVPDGRGERLLDWPTAVRIPWGLLLLFSGGIALGSGFRAAGLDTALGDALAQLASWPLPATVLALAVVVTFTTEVLSNTATAALLMPILGAAATSAGEPVAAWLVPAGLSASCAFMLPVSTAPNAIVVGSGHVTAGTMVREGLAMNLLGAAMITAATVWLLPG
jgi:sodium-dependent dicarboxylate transporter 2/3/5